MTKENNKQIASCLAMTEGNVIANGVKQSANKKEIASARLLRTSQQELRNDETNKNASLRDFSSKQSLSLVPKLRFKEFEGEWIKTTLGDLFTFKNGLNSDKEKYGTGIKFINVLDIIGESVITYDSIFGKVEITDKELEKNEVIYGDVLFQRSSETREEVGQANVYVDKNKSAVFGGFVIRGRKKVDYNPYFINYLLKTSSARKEITTKSGGSTRYNVGQDSLSEVLIKLTNLKEQQKIATFLTAVDTKLQQLNKKKELLANYKKGVMQQLFSQQLRFKPTPSLRGTKQSLDNNKKFPDWEEKRLGEVCIKIQDGNYGASYPKTNEFIEIGIPFLTSKALGTGGSIISNKIDFIPIKKHQELKKAHLMLNDVLFTNRGANVGAIAFVDTTISHGNIGPQLTLLRVDMNIIESTFLYHSMNSFKVRKQVRSQDSGSAMNFFGIGATSKFKISLPSLKEQQKIATYLSAIDTKIENVQTQIDKTQAFKKGLLQQMFV
ncbi:type I restriction enzyme, S subunit [Polaribacter sp. KT25b]|uniref:restriction endonuclease subunit S n=1 Tax=Polaribacter sp. KT25b TaxID=1855336 RepID=UPI00087D8F9F|nr:restriction endonuclease subunit S [Polaribacter sp. KT25b]SDR97186.1 type I restriction enzyme, S subunit [Polaribacter sp. KT25b]